MSWGVNVPKVKAQQFFRELAEVEIGDTHNPPRLVKQWRDQLTMAKSAARQIFQELARVDDDEAGTEFSASLSGHANHGGAGDGSGYTAQEFISVTVNRIPAPPKPAE